MKIALFPSAFYPSFGGVEEVCRQLAHACVRRGHTVSISTERWPRTLPNFEFYENLPLRRYPMRVPANGWKAKLSYMLTHQSIRRRIVRDIRAMQADIVHVHCVSTAAWYALHVSRALRLPLVATLHGELNMDASRIFQRSEIHARILRTTLREADAITTCSGQTLQEAEAYYGQPLAQRARVIHNGIDLDEFTSAQPFSHPRPYIFAIGRHVREKGFDVLLQAFKRAGDLAHELILAGDGTETASLKALACRLGVAHKTHFVGRVDHAEAIRLFKGCSFFVLASRHEPFGVVNLEAMAAGRAIVASRVGGVPEIVKDEETGLLVPAEDEVALAQALRRLAEDASLRERLGRAGKRHVHSFEWNQVAGEYLKVYENVLARRC